MFGMHFGLGINIQSLGSYSLSASHDPFCCQVSINVLISFVYERRNRFLFSGYASEARTPRSGMAWFGLGAGIRLIRLMMLRSPKCSFYSFISPISSRTALRTLRAAFCV